MDKDKIIVFDTNNQRKTISRYEYYARLMQQVVNQERKGDK